MLKKKSVIYLIILALVVLLVLTACERKGTLNANLRPYISITDYFGADSTNQITESHLFQQTVQWSGTDEDGIVEGYAFRVLNEDGVPIATPGYDVLDENGWVKFYTQSADQSIPLNQSAQTTIWMDQGYATINFPAADANGDSANVVSLFEVKCKDNRGDESDVASRYFQAYSYTPNAMIVSKINGESISTAIIFEFKMDDGDPFVGDDAYYYKYKLEKRDLDGVIIPDSGYDDEWLSTLGFDNVKLSLHSALNGNALIPNTLENDIPQDSTFLRVKAVDTALIESDEIEISFIVKEGFYPDTIIYYGDGNANANGIYSLGANHFATYLDDALSDILPSVQTSDGAHHATSFWYDSEEKYSAIGSNDFKTYMRWGYSGEYEEDNPQKPKDGITLDEITGNPYFCEIVGYDLRLDGAPYYYPPIPAIEEYGTLQIDEDGTEWMRVYSMFPIYQATTVTLTSYGGNLEDMYGEHTFEVRAIDLQGAVDETPHEFTYTIVPPIPKEEKSGVLVIDDDGDTPNSPAELIDSLYTYYVSSYDTEPGYINREDMNALGMDGLHHGKSVIAPSDIQQYKVIIYHADNPTAEFSFWKEFEALKIYMLQGGNIILSGGSNLKIMNQKCTENGFNILDDYFGIPMDNEDAIMRVSTSFSDYPFFISAIAEGSYNDIELLLPSFNTTITNIYAPFLSRNGLGPVAYFDEEVCEAEVIYRYGCKDVDDPGQYLINPTQEQYDLYNGLSVALKKVTEDNSCYIFGFPLAYMEADQVKTMMTQILNEIP